MENETKDAPEVLETPAGEAETPQDSEGGEQLTAEQIAELRAKAAKADDLEEKNKKLFERAKKAEQKAPSQGDLSSRDVLAITRANVPDADVDEVIDFAKYKSISIAEALTNSTLKSILSDRQEERRTAEATQTRGGARGATKISGADLLAKAKESGEVPDTDEGMAALVQARFEARHTRRR